MTGERPLLGMALMLGFCLLAPLADSLAKILGAVVPLLLLILIRFGVQAVLLTPLVLRQPLPRHGWRLMFIRTLLHIAGIGSMFQGLKFLPLADAVAIAFVMPFILLLLGKYIEGEEVGHRRLLACVVGFVGTLAVMQPSFLKVGLPALWPVSCAIAFAFFMLVTRRLARTGDPVTIQCVSGYMAVALLGPMALWAVSRGWVVVDAEAWTPLVWVQIGLLGVVGTVAHLLMTWSLRFAPSTTLAPMQYLEIPIATVAGWMIFRDFPDGLALFGIGLILAAGLYVVWRERRLSLQAQALRSPAEGSHAEG